jgi:hypothetical protein
MEDIIKVNKIELASELAHKKLLETYPPSMKIYEDEQADITNYTDEAQDIFNEYYDEYLELINMCKE